MFGQKKLRSLNAFMAQVIVIGHLGVLLKKSCKMIFGKAAVAGSLFERKIVRIVSINKIQQVSKDFIVFLLLCGGRGGIVGMAKEVAASNR